MTTLNTQKNYLPYIFFTVLFIINLPFLLSYAQSYTATLAKFTCDEVEFLFNIDLILEQLALGKILGAAYNLYTFGYGSVYWGISALVAAPCWMLGSEHGVVVSLRLLSLTCSIGAFYLIFKLLNEYSKNSLLTYISILFCFFSPVIISYANMIHPEALFCFFLVLAFYWLHRDNTTFKKYYYKSLCAFAFAISTKLIAALFGIAYIIHFIVHRRTITFFTIIKSFLMGFLFFAGLNIFLVFPLIAKRFVGWVTHESQAVMYGLDLQTINPLSARINFFSDQYLNIFAFILIMTIAFYGISIRRALMVSSRLCSNLKALRMLCQSRSLLLSIVERSNHSFYFVFCSSWLIITSYALFCLFYCAMPYHYGIALMFFLPLVIANAIGAHMVRDAQLRFAPHHERRKIVLITMLFFLNHKTFISAARLLLYPTGSQRTQDVSVGLKKVAHFMAHYKKPIRSLGIAAPLFPPHEYRRKMAIRQLFNLDENNIKNLEAIILWKKEPINNHRMLESYFEKVYEDQEIEVYTLPLS